MLKNSKYFNQLIINNSNIQKRLSQFIEGVDLDEIIKTFDYGSIANFSSDDEIFNSEITNSKWKVKFERRFANHYNSTSYSNVNQKNSKITIFQGDITLILEGTDNCFAVRRITPKQNIKMEANLNLQSGALNIKQYGSSEHTKLDDEGMKILQEQNAERTRLEEEQDIKLKLLIEKKAAQEKLLNDLIHKQACLDYAIDCKCYIREGKCFPHGSLTCLLPRDFKYVVFEDENYIKNLISNAGELKTSVKKVIINILKLIEEAYCCFGEKDAVIFLTTPVFDIIPREVFVSSEDYDNLENKKINDPDLYPHIIVNILNEMIDPDDELEKTPAVALGLQDLSTGITACCDAIRIANKYFPQDEVIKVINYILGCNAYYGLKKNAIVFNLSDLLWESFNPKFNNKEKKEILDCADEYINALAPEVVANSINKAEKAYERIGGNMHIHRDAQIAKDFKCYEELLAYNYQIYEQLTKEYPLIRKKDF